MGEGAAGSLSAYGFVRHARWHCYFRGRLFVVVRFLLDKFRRASAAVKFDRRRQCGKASAQPRSGKGQTNSFEPESLIARRHHRCPPEVILVVVLLVFAATRISARTSGYKEGAVVQGCMGWVLK